MSVRAVAMVLVVGCAADPDAVGEPAAAGIVEEGGTAPTPDPTPVFAPLEASGEVVERVDLPRYLGTWYEIGTYVIPFQAACVGSTAQYGVVDDDTISVRNRCLIDDFDGRVFAITGTADLVDASGACLSVTFFGDFGAPYWVIELDDQPGDQPYDWAVVSGPDNATLWILYREPQMPDSLLDPIVERLVARGFDEAEISWTVQPEAPFTEEELASTP